MKALKRMYARMNAILLSRNLRTPAKRALILATVTGVAAVGIGFGAVAGTRLLNAARHPKTGVLILLPGKDGDVTMLHNGWRIHPAGRHVDAGDMLLGGAVSPDGSTFAIVNGGYGPVALHLIDMATEKEVAKLPLGKAWNGIAWASDSKRIYVSGGTSVGFNDVFVIEKSAAGEWARAASLKLGVDPRCQAMMCVAGLSLSSDQKTLFALDNSYGFLYSVDVNSGEARGHIPVGDHPVSCKLAADGKTLYVANWGAREVAKVDISDPAAMSVATRIPTGDHPNDLALSSDGRLFVSCGNDDGVSVYDLNADRALETVKTTLTPASPSGSTPVAVALAPDGKTLYVANADNNDLCVIDVSKRGSSRVIGFIPTGWYPTAVGVSPDGKRILVGSGKGTGTGPNLAKLPINQNAPGGFTHLGRQLNGQVSFVDVPSKSQLTAYTEQTRACSPYNDLRLKGSDSARVTAIPSRIGDKSPIKYVLYIIKENRTYDQVYGDMPKGNGDPNLCLFGREVTPNQHALAEQYTLLDNLYCNGEVSQDGHPWSTSAIASDFMQRAWVISYSGKGKIPLPNQVVDPKAGYLWQQAERNGLSVRNYGEMRDHPSWGNNQSDSFVGKVGPNQPPPGRDTDKADIFIDEFRQFEKAGTIPRLMVMSLGEDHTTGTRPGSFTPKAAVASNDVAVGKIVDAVSHSSAWKEFAIFIIEDDAQNGPDHVDAHRTTGLVVSPYTRRGTVDSTMYSTASMLRTMELILGLKPLTQYDAAATPMFESFTDRPDLAAFTLISAKIDLNAKNGMAAYGARQSARMDWSDFDRVDEDALNRILWHSIKGAAVPMPAPVRSAAPCGTVVARKLDADD